MDGDNCYNGHEGVDLGTFAAEGVSVYASARGVVFGQPANIGDGFGFTVKISHSQINLLTTYNHLQVTTVVNNGQFVERGQLIGYSGCSGTCYGPHLHFGVQNSATGGAFLDPYGWAFPDHLSTDPYASNIGHLWGTRIATFTSGSIQAKEGHIGSGWETGPGNMGFPGSGAVTAMSVDGSRVATVQGGTAYIKDGSLNQSFPSAGWQTLAYNAVDVKLAGKRIGVIETNGTLDMKDGALNSGWYLNVASNVWKLAMTPTRIGVVEYSGAFKLKEGTISPVGWSLMMAAGQAKQIALTDTWIGAIRADAAYVDQFWVKDTINGQWVLIRSQPTTSIVMGGRGQDKRFVAISLGSAWAKEESLGGSWKDLGPAVEAAVNSGRAARRESNGNIYVSQTETLAFVGGGVVVTGSGVRLN